MLFLPGDVAATAAAAGGELVMAAERTAEGGGVGLSDRPRKKSMTDQKGGEV